MLSRLKLLTTVFGLFALGASAPLAAEEVTRQFDASSGGTLTLELDAGGSVVVTGTGGSSVSVAYTISPGTSPDITVDAVATREGVTVTSSRTRSSQRHRSRVDFRIAVPSRFNIKLDSKGGAFEVDGVDGTFSGTTMGGPLTLNKVHGQATLTTMGGAIRVTGSELDGALKTMGGEVLFEDVIGDVSGSSMGGNVRYKNVKRRNGEPSSPARTGGHDETTGETVQVSTMGGAIEIDDAPNGADLHTMGGNISVKNAKRFVRAKTMGGDIRIESVDGSLKATTMGGDIEATVVGSGGDIDLTSMSGDITLHVPAGLAFDIELQIAFTKGSRKSYEIATPFQLTQSTTSEWDYKHGSARKYIRAKGSVGGGGGHTLKIETINGNIRIVEGN
jgi:DUF4097 and DUF4098 domain-containing protein YvlB